MEEQRKKDEKERRRQRQALKQAEEDMLIAKVFTSFLSFLKKDICPLYLRQTIASVVLANILCVYVACHAFGYASMLLFPFI
jgi:hypothetical protein